MSDLPAPVQSVRTTLLLHAVVAAAILIVAALSSIATARAFFLAGLYFVLAGGWSWIKARRATDGSAASRGGRGR